MLNLWDTVYVNGRFASMTGEGLGLVEKLFEVRDLWIGDKLLLDECSSLVSKNGRIQAMHKGRDRRSGSPEYGYYDDIVFSLIGALLYEEVAPIVKAPNRRRLEEAYDYQKKQKRAEAAKRGYHQFQ